MKCTVAIVLLGLVALVATRPDFELDLDDIHQDQDIDDDNTITGSYSWTSPEGIKYFVRYVADDDGYRIVESNAVPVSPIGQRADGIQGSFESFEGFDDRK